MHISLFNTLITILSIASSALAEWPLYPSYNFSGDPDYCAGPFIYNIAFHPHKELLSTFHNITVPQGGVKHCCNLCYHSTHNCMLAQYNEVSSICSMSIIKKASKRLKPAGPKLEGQCPFGVSDKGALALGRLGRGAYMGGPCWTTEDNFSIE